MIKGIFFEASGVLYKRDEHPLHYALRLIKAHLSPHQAAFVSHDARELAGAHQVGMATVAVLGDPEIKADYYAETLPDLLNVPILQR